MNRPNNMSHIAVRFDVKTWLNMMDIVRTGNFIKRIISEVENTIANDVSEERLDAMKELDYLYSRKRIFEKVVQIDLDRKKSIAMADVLRALVKKGIKMWEIEQSANSHKKPFVRSIRIYNHFDVKEEKDIQTDKKSVYLSFKKDFGLEKTDHDKLKEICCCIDCPIAVYVRRLVRLTKNELERRHVFGKYISDYDIWVLTRCSRFTRSDQL